MNLQLVRAVFFQEKSWNSGGCKEKGLRVRIWAWFGDLGDFRMSNPGNGEGPDG